MPFSRYNGSHNPMRIYPSFIGNDNRFYNLELKTLLLLPCWLNEIHVSVKIDIVLFLGDSQMEYRALF